VAKGEQPSQFAALGEVFDELFRQLSRAATNPGEVNEIFDVNGALRSANQRLVTEAQRMPVPLDRWLGTLATDIGRLTASGARASLSDLWQTTGGRFCRTAIAGRYPFNKKAENDVAINDFVRMFGPSGEFSNFFELHLKPFVDVAQSPWQWTGVAGNEAIASEALEQFEKAKRIQTAFFAGGNDLSVTMDVTPVELDNEATSVLLSINDQNITYDHGPVQTKSMQWPGDGNRSARIAFQPPGENASMTRTGPWAMFRLFDLAKRDAASEDKFRATFALGGRSAVFDIQTGSVLNPFSLAELQSFECPDSL
jgi:type VI secretion system protein ImpL